LLQAALRFKLVSSKSGIIEITMKITVSKMFDNLAVNIS